MLLLDHFAAFVPECLATRDFGYKQLLGDAKFIEEAGDVLLEGIRSET